jgi:hypothetical protein
VRKPEPADVEPVLEVDSATGAVVEETRAGDAPGIPSSTAPGGGDSFEWVALHLIDSLGEIDSREHWLRWRSKHVETLAHLLRCLPESRLRKKLAAMGEAKRLEFEQPVAKA